MEEGQIWQGGLITPPMDAAILSEDTEQLGVFKKEMVGKSL